MSENRGDKFNRSTSLILFLAVAAATVILPAGFMVATGYFGWEPPEFLQQFTAFFKG